jgi:hypothetical protein
MNKLNFAAFTTFVVVLSAGAAFAQAAAAPTASTSAATASTPAPAAASSTAPAVTTAAAAPDENEVICETQAPPTGSLIGKTRICRTRREWKAQESQDQVGQDLHRESMGAGPQ